MSIIDEPKRPASRSPAVKAVVDIPEPAFWVGHVLRPHKGGWVMRRVRLSNHLVEMFATDTPHPADSRRLVVARVIEEISHPTLSVKTDWGSDLPDPILPPEPEQVEMLDHHFFDKLGQPQPVYRLVSKAGWDALPAETKAAFPMRTK